MLGGTAVVDVVATMHALFMLHLTHERRSTSVWELRWAIGDKKIRQPQLAVVYRLHGCRNLEDDALRDIGLRANLIKKQCVW